jgi:hypothetical protein
MDRPAGKKNPTMTTRQQLKPSKKAGGGSRSGRQGLAPCGWLAGGAPGRSTGAACREPMRQRETRDPGRGSRNDSLVPPIVHEVLRSPGQPLDPATRAFMEPRFGHDFSQVRVHTDPQAAESARTVNALAYTMERDVVFGAGQYAPGRFEGQRLLAHELTHVVQQGRAGGRALQSKTPGPDGGTPEEKAADKTAKQVVPAPTGTTADAGTTPAEKKPPSAAPPIRTTPGTTGSSAQGRYVVYQDEVRVAGSRAWRNNNPGNMRGPFATAHGAIGHDDAKFAAFPDYATGRTALVELLKSSTYVNLTIEGVMNKYAPPSENNTTKYIATIVAGTGVSKETKLNALTDDQIGAITDVIEVVEGTIPGTIYTCAEASAPANFRTMLGCADVKPTPAK